MHADEAVHPRMNGAVIAEAAVGREGAGSRSVLKLWNIGWGTGRAVVVNCECELARVVPGDILVTRVAGPALGEVLARVAGVVTELGGSTSHLASLALANYCALPVLDFLIRGADLFHASVLVRRPPRRRIGRSGWNAPWLTQPREAAILGSAQANPSRWP